MGELAEIVLSYPKLADRIQNDRQLRNKALKNLSEIKADYSKSYVLAFEKILDAALPQLYEGIHLNQNNLPIAEWIGKKSVIFVPNHQSHADYLAMGYIFYKEFQSPLYVAGGNNLNIFPIGTLFRKSGCFFIRRSFQNDILYKLTLEAYLYYLLKTKKPIEFFFEGGRSRTGKLLPPRFGLFHMLLEAHKELEERHGESELIFVPVSINHEYVPEQKSLVKELRGAKKTKESTMQLFGLLKLFSHQYGTIHLTLGEPIGHQDLMSPQGNEIKELTQKLAFKCFLEVGRNMSLTPSSLFAYIILDGPSGALTWDEIRKTGKKILDFCYRFSVPVTNSLGENQWEESLKKSLDMFISNGKVRVIGQRGDSPLFYTVGENDRAELLYFKNSILHHFLVPWGIAAAWVTLFSGEIQSIKDLQRFFLDRRNQLKYEFYLPSTKEFLSKTLEIIGTLTGRKVLNLNECLELSQKDLYQLATHIGVFARSLNYIFESYYLSAQAARSLLESAHDGFKVDIYLKKYREIFTSEKSLGRVIKYPESDSDALARSALKYFENSGYLSLNEGRYVAGTRGILGDAAAQFEMVLKRTLSLQVSADA